jgi:hypothetical protein
MTFIEAALRDVLMAYKPLTDLISTRMYPVVFPVSATYPRATFEKISDPEPETKIHNMVISFTVQGSTYLSAETVMGHIRDCLLSYSGIKSGLTISAIFATGQISQTCDLTVPVYERVELFRVIYES